MVTRTTTTCLHKESGLEETLLLLLLHEHHLITCLAIIYVIMRHCFWLMDLSELGDYDSLKIAGLRRA